MQLSERDEYRRSLAAQTYGFAERGRETLDRVCDAWQRWCENETEIEPLVIEDLRADLVSQAFFDVHRYDFERDRAALGTFIEAVERSITGSPGATILRALAAELDGDAVATRRGLDAVLENEPNHGTAVLRSMILAVDQSRFDDAVRMNGRLFGRDEQSAGPLPEFAAAMISVGRNEPCPCGSGRKYKQCHPDQPVLSEPEATQALMFKVERFTDDAAYGDQFRLDQDDAASLMALVDNPVTRDLMVYDGGFLARYLTERRSFLPEVDIARLESWSSASLELYEVTSVDPGNQIGLRNVRSGEPVNLIGSAAAVVGEHRLMRVVIDAGVPATVGVAFSVPEEQVADVVALLNKPDRSVEDLIVWATDALS